MTSTTTGVRRGTLCRFFDRSFRVWVPTWREYDAPARKCASFAAGARWPLPCFMAVMSKLEGKGASVIVVGGSGGMSERYRAVVEERGLELRHYENRVPNGTRRLLGKVAAVIVMVGMVSHSLRDQAKALVPADAPVVYLKSASVSALRDAVASLDVPTDRA